METPTAMLRFPVLSRQCPNNVKFLDVPRQLGTLCQGCTHEMFVIITVHNGVRGTGSRNDLWSGIRSIAGSLDINYHNFHE